MNVVETCPACGAALPHRGWEGLCPRCVAKVGLGAVLAAPRPEQATREESPPHPATPLAAGARLGDYEILDEIARGGMGIVYRARQRSLNRVVALKMILAGPKPKPEFLQRFRTEAEAAASLRHPNIVAIYDIAEDAGRPFFSMEYVAGRNLSEIAADGPLPPERAARYVQKVAAAIHFAHERGILHRDIKPSNILVDEFDEPRVTDFGLAKRLSTELDVTVTGQLLGSPQYFAPEQMSSRRGEVGPRTDVYSLGAVLYHLLAGRPPFQAATMEEVLLHVIDTEPVSPGKIAPGVPRDLETICLKCLEKEASRRYGSAQEVAEELARFEAGEPIRARPCGRVERAWRWSRKRPALAVAALMAIVALAALIFASRKRGTVAESWAGEPTTAFTFTDETFADTNWTLFVETNGTGGTQTARQITEGQPGSRREITTRVGRDSGVRGYHLRRDAVYVPTLRGPITALDMTGRAALQPEGNPHFGLVAVQNGRRYLAPARALAYGGWSAFEERALTARDFTLQIGFQSDASAHPDFSGGGGPIQFGFALYDSSDTLRAHAGVVEIASWKVEARGPPPGEFPLTDGDFAAADWTLHPDTGGTTATMTGIQLRSGGQPGACWQVRTDLSDRAAIAGSWFHSRALYSPAQQGALASVDLSVEAQLPEESVRQNTGTFVLAVIAQAGRLFTTGEGRGITYVKDGGWMPLRFAAFPATKFVEVTGWSERNAWKLNGESHPDFSTNGPPLRLGFMIYYNTYDIWTNAPASRATASFDNFRVAVTRAR